MNRFAFPSLVITRVLAVLVLGLLSFLTFAPDAYAQRGQGGQRGQRAQVDKATWVERQMTSMADSVALMAAQSAEIRVLFEGHFDRMEALREEVRGQGREAMQGMREQMQTLQEELDAEVVLLLSPEQAARYQAWREAQQDRPRRRRGIGG